MKKRLMIVAAVTGILINIYSMNYILVKANNPSITSSITLNSENIYDKIMNISQIKKGNAYIPDGTDVTKDVDLNVSLNNLEEEITSNRHLGKNIVLN